MGEYKYMVVYSVGTNDGRSGIGRCFTVTNKTIETPEQIESLEKEINNKQEFKNLFIISFQLL